MVSVSKEVEQGRVIEDTGRFCNFTQVVRKGPKEKVTGK